MEIAPELRYSPEAIRKREEFAADRHGYLVCGRDVLRAAFAAICPGLDSYVDRASFEGLYWIRVDGEICGAVELCSTWIVIHVGRKTRRVYDQSADFVPGTLRGICRRSAQYADCEFRMAWRLSRQGEDAAFVQPGRMEDDMGCRIPECYQRLRGDEVFAAIERASAEEPFCGSRVERRIATQWF